MINISISGYFSDFNEFKIKEIFISDVNDLFILKANESFLPRKYYGSVEDLFDSTKNLYYPSYSMAEFRCYSDDDDAKSLANFLMQKIINFNLREREAHKKLFDIISSFGETCNAQ